jgi:hypothetical protein
MKIKQSSVICILISLIFVVMLAGTAIAPISSPAIDIEKYTNGEDVTTMPGPEVSVGSTVTWTYNVTNTGNVPLTSVTVMDQNNQGDPVATITNIVNKGNGDDTLDVGESWIYQATGTAILGQYTNNGLVSAYYDITRVKDVDKSHYFGIENEIPEFPTIALPMLAIMGLAFVFMRRKE